MKLKVSTAALHAGPLLGLLLLPGAVSALSLGEAQLQSRYGQPLQLRLPVELGSEDEQADAGLVQARLLGQDYYEAQGVAPPEVPASEFSIRTEQDQGRTWAVITTQRALREPMLTLFVSVRLGPSWIIREVPVLLEFQERAAPRPAPVAAPAAEAVMADVPGLVSEPVQGVVSAPPAVAAETQPAAAPPPRKRRRLRPAVESLPGAALQASAATGLRLESGLSRPDGYSRFRLDESFSSFRQALPAAAAAAASVATEEPPPPEVSGQTESSPAVETVSVAAESNRAGKAPESGLSWWTYAWLLGLAAVFVYLARRQGKAKLPHLNIATLPGRYETRYSEREHPAEPSALPEPQAPPMPVAEAAPPPTESRPVQPAEPLSKPLLLIEDALAPSAESVVQPREGYPNQDLRDRVAQLARLMSTASEKRKLELVKAYIDVERTDSAQKLLTELEDKHYGSSQPERLDFELV